MGFFECLLLVFVGFGAGFVQRVSGFGLGIFAMIFLPHFMPTHTAAAAISSIFSCGTTTFNAIKYRKKTSYKTALPMLIASLVTIPFAVCFSSKISSRIFEILLGAVLVILSIYFLFLGNKIRIKATAANGAISGALGGILGGLFSTGGPPAVLYLASAAPDNDTYFATIQFYFCITNLYATATRALGGVINWQVLIFSAIGMIGCMLGDFVGGLVFKKLDSAKLKLIIYIGMIASGIIMIF